MPSMSKIRAHSRFYCVMSQGFERIPAPKFEFVTIWIKHPSGLTIHLIEGEPSFRLMEGPNRNADTGERAKRAFSQGLLDPIHLRRGHHLAFDITDMEGLKATLDEAGIPYGTNHIPGSTTQQIWFCDEEGNGIEGVYRLTEAGSSS